MLNRQLCLAEIHWEKNIYILWQYFWCYRMTYWCLCILQFLINCISWSNKKYPYTVPCYLKYQNLLFTLKWTDNHHNNAGGTIKKKKNMIKKNSLSSLSIKQGQYFDSTQSHTQRQKTIRIKHANKINQQPWTKYQKMHNKTQWFTILITETKLLID